VTDKHDTDLLRLCLDRVKVAMAVSSTATDTSGRIRARHRLDVVVPQLLDELHDFMAWKEARAERQARCEEREKGQDGMSDVFMVQIRDRGGDEWNSRARLR
jgi:hypothetical protein